MPLNFIEGNDRFIEENQLLVVVFVIFGVNFKVPSFIIMTRTILFLVLTAITSQSFGQTDILGCMDSTACNYNLDATVDDDSCDFCSCSDGTWFETSEAEYGVEIEVIAEHSEGDLSGMTTYRLYLTVPSENDEITSFTGNDEFALSLATTTSFYQEPIFGGVTPENISEAAIGFIPNLAYDSWVTVGLDGPASSVESATSLYLAHGFLTSKMEIALLLMMESDLVGTFFQVHQIVLLVQICVFFLLN